MVSEECKAGSLFGSVYRLSADGTQLNTINLPAGANPSAGTESFEYGIYNHQLYRYNDNTMSYDSIFTFNPPFGKYVIKNVKTRLIVLGYDGTPVANASYPVFSVRERVFILSDERKPQARLLQSFEMNSDTHY